MPIRFDPFNPGSWGATGVPWLSRLFPAPSVGVRPQHGLGLGEGFASLTGGKLAQQSIEGRARWSHNVMPLTVRVAPWPIPDRPSPEPMIWQACRIWEQASGGRVSFQHAVIQQAESAPCRPAHIEFLWRDEPLAGRDAAVGRANRRLSADGWIEAVTIELLMAPAIDVELPEARLGARWLATALHELGHALGLEHSIHPNDVMHFRGWQNTRLSDWDLRQLHGLYPPATNVNAFHRLS